jgi:hypothetical protein
MLICYFAATQTARLLFTAFAIFAFSEAAEAQYITYVASNGNDANPCTVVTAPCKTLQKAVNVTTANGTVRVLTPLISSVFINKSITISGDGVPIVGQITIGGATATVTLQGLALDGVEGFVNGIRIDAAAVVYIEDCTVERYTGAGIRQISSAATKLFVSDTASRDNIAGLVVENTGAQVVVENSRFENNFYDGLEIHAAKASVTRSVVSGSQYGISVYTGTANITETTVADNTGAGIFVDSGGVAILAASVARGSGQGLLVSPGASAIITDSVFTHNNTGIHNTGTLHTRNNNTLNWNVTDYDDFGGDGVRISATAF